MRPAWCWPCWLSTGCYRPWRAHCCCRCISAPIPFPVSAVVSGLVNAALVWAAGYWTDSKRLAALPLWTWLGTVAAFTLGGPGGDIVFGGSGVMAYSVLILLLLGALPATLVLRRMALNRPLSRPYRIVRPGPLSRAALPGAFTGSRRDRPSRRRSSAVSTMVALAAVTDHCGRGDSDCRVRELGCEPRRRWRADQGPRRDGSASAAVVPGFGGGGPRRPVSARHRVVRLDPASAVSVSTSVAVSVFGCRRLTSPWPPAATEAAAGGHRGRGGTAGTAAVAAADSEVNQ